MHLRKPSSSIRHFLHEMCKISSDISLFESRTGIFISACCYTPPLATRNACFQSNTLYYESPSILPFAQESEVIQWSVGSEPKLKNLTGGNHRLCRSALAYLHKRRRRRRRRRLWFLKYKCEDNSSDSIMHNAFYSLVIKISAH